MSRRTEDLQTPSRRGHPLGTKDFAATGRWWEGQIGSLELVRMELRLRHDFVRPHTFGRQVPRVWLHTGMKDLIRHRGIAARLYLVALFEEQLRHAGQRQLWRAGLVRDRSEWKDSLTLAGEIRNPSWASLTLGFDSKPPSRAQYASWHRTRYEAVTNGFARLAAVELVDPKRVPQNEDRAWRWNRDIAERRYSFPGSTDSFAVPPELFTSGLYTRLSGAGLYTVLLAFQRRATPKAPSPFRSTGLTWKTFDAGHEELTTKLPPPSPPKKVLLAVEALRKVREEHQESWSRGRASSA